MKPDQFKCDIGYASDPTGTDDAILDVPEQRKLRKSENKEVREETVRLFGRNRD